MNLRPNVSPIRPNIYQTARSIISRSDDDWPAMLRAAETLAGSPEWTDQEMARLVRDAYARHLRHATEDMALRHIAEASVKSAMRRRAIDLIAAVAMIAVLFVVLRAGFLTLLALDGILAKAAATAAW